MSVSISEAIIDVDAISAFLLHAQEGATIHINPSALEHVSAYNDFDSQSYRWPALSLPCANKLCHNLPHIYEPEFDGISPTYDSSEPDKVRFGTLIYKCTHCKTEEQVFAVVLSFDKAGSIVLRKFGQIPPRGGPLPPSILNLADEECKDLLRKGLRCERYSLGNGAFTYYRLALEGMWPRILDDLETLSTHQTQRKAILRAKFEKRITRSFKLATPALPASLKTGTDTPLTLLYSAVSQGLHPGVADEQCLQLARSVLTSLLALLNGISDLKNYNAMVQQSNAQLSQFIAKQKLAKHATHSEPSDDRP